MALSVARPSEPDGMDVGVDQDALEDALGWVKNARVLSLAATSFAVAFHSPDSSTACYVGYGTGSNPTTWSVTAANILAQKERTIAVTGLTAKTAYYFQVWCSKTAPTATAIVRTF